MSEWRDADDVAQEEITEKMLAQEKQYVNQEHKAMLLDHAVRIFNTLVASGQSNYDFAAAQTKKVLDSLARHTGCDQVPFK